MPACSITGVRLAASSASCAKRSWFGSSSCRWNGDGMPSSAERRRVGLVAADQQALAVGLVVDEVVRVAHRRHVRARRACPSIGPVSTYWCSTANAGTRTPAMRPTSRPHMPAALTTISQLDVAADRGVHRGHPPAVDGDRRRPRVSSRIRAPRVARALGERLGDAGRIDVAVGRQERRGEHVRRSTSAGTAPAPAAAR